MDMSPSVWQTFVANDGGKPSDDLITICESAFQSCVITFPNSNAGPRQCSYLPGVWQKFKGTTTNAINSVISLLKIINNNFIEAIELWETTWHSIRWHGEKIIPAHITQYALLSWSYQLYTTQCMFCLLVCTAVSTTRFSSTSWYHLS